MCAPSISFRMCLCCERQITRKKEENEICFSHLSVYAIAFIRTTELQASLSMGRKVTNKSVFGAGRGMKRAQKHKQSRCTEATAEEKKHQFKKYKQRTKAQAKCTKYVPSFWICAIFFLISHTIFTQLFFPLHWFYYYCYYYFVCCAIVQTKRH